MAVRRAVLFSLLLLAACADARSPTPAGAVASERPGWQTMGHIRLAAFSAHDAREYDVMVFCDGADHVRLYHLVPPDEPSAELALRSGDARLLVAGQRELVRATPPPVSSEEGAVLGARISARLERASPLWRAVEETGALEIRSGGHLTDARATSSERAALASLFSECS